MAPMFSRTATVATVLFFAILVSASSSLVAQLSPAETTALIEELRQAPRGPYPRYLLVLLRWQPTGRPRPLPPTIVARTNTPDYTPAIKR